MEQDTNDEGAVCTKCGTVVESLEEWEARHKHGER